MALAPAALTATIGLAATVRFARGLTIAARLAAVRAGGTLTVTARSLSIAARGLAILTRAIVAARGRALITARSLTIAARSWAITAWFGAGFAAWHVAKGALFAFLRCERVEHRAARWG